MFSQEDEVKILKGFELGFSDYAIARNVGVKPMVIYIFRTGLNIKSKDVLRNRYEIWKQLIREGKPIEEIAEMYDVKKRSLSVVLWKQGFSIKDRYVVADAKKEFSAKSASKDSKR